MEAGIVGQQAAARRTRGLPTNLLGDERLAREVALGSDSAFATLFGRYHQTLYRYCRSLTGSEQDAQDALQSAFTKALVALREGRRSAPLRPWLFRIAHNESISMLRARETAAELSAELVASDELARSVEDRERMATLLADLRELPERQRGALVMRELSGLSHAEIAEALQISVGAAKQTILEARRSLLEFAEGRAMGCEAVQQILSDDDRRALRARRVRAHLRACGRCAAFAQAIPQRRADMLALWPALPMAGATGLLAKLTGAGSGHGGGGAGMAAGTAAKGIGATVSLKAAVATGAAVVATASVGAVAVLHRPARERAAAPPRPAVVRHPSNPAPRRGSLTAVSSQPAAVPAHRSVHRRSAEGAELHRARHRDAPVARPSVVREKLKPATAVAPPAGRSRAATAPRSHVHQGAPHAVRAMHSPAAARKHTPRTATPAARIGKPKHVSRGRAAPKPHPAGGAGVRGKSSPSAHSPAAPAPAAPTRSTVAASATSTGNAATGPTGGQPAGASAGHSANKSASTS